LYTYFFGGFLLGLVIKLQSLHRPLIKIGGAYLKIN
jgi:hypothetical protein